MANFGNGTPEKAGAKCRAVKPRGLTALRFPRMGSGCTSPRGEANPSYGSRAVLRLSRGQTPVKRDTVPLGFRVDNIRFAPDGSILAAGQGQQTTNVVRVDPETLKITELINQPNTESFASGTVAIPIGNDLWVGSFRGDRLAIFPASK